MRPSRMFENRVRGDSTGRESRKDQAVKSAKRGQPEDERVFYVFFFSVRVPFLSSGQFARVHFSGEKPLGIVKATVS